MKQYREVIGSVMQLIGDDENYIIFNDAKPVDNRFIDEGVDIKVNDPYDFISYGYKVCDLEKEINENAKFTTTITITKSMTLKLVHICDDVKYINYQLEIMPRCNVKIINLYLHVITDARINLNMIVHHQAHVDYYEVNKFVKDNFKNLGLYLSHQTDVNVNTICLDKARSTTDEAVHLMGERGNVKVLNVCVASNNQVITQNAKVIHHDGNTNSLFNAYGISKDNSSIYFNNNGYIDNGAHKAVMNQKTKGIVLDSESEIKALPALYIDEDDVIANHGASVGSINEDDLYYLMSRGLTKEESEALIVNAFINPFFKDLNDQKIEDYIKGIIKESL